MFGISGAEFLVLLVVAVIFLGPKHAAQAVSAIRKGIGYIRNYSAQLREQMAANRTKVALEDLGISAEDLAALRELRASTGSLDPRAYVRKAVSEEMNAWLDIAPMPVHRADNLPHAGKGVSLEQARAEFQAKKAAAAGASSSPSAQPSASTPAANTPAAGGHQSSESGENIAAHTVESMSESAPKLAAEPSGGEPETP